MTTVPRRWMIAEAIIASCALSLIASPTFALRTEDVEWTNGDVTLSGTVYLPDGAGPHPGFVFLHGAGPETRTAFTMTRYAREFAKHGIAMLLYDKRGTGKSTGDWMQSDYSDLANDAVQGIELLVKRKDIDPKHIGVIGASEGGWTGPLTANRSPYPSLLILISAPPMSPFEQGFFDMRNELRSAGLSESDIAEAIELERLTRQVQRTDEGWDDLDRAVEAAKSKPWYEAAGSPDRPDPSNPRSSWYARIMDYDPVPALRAIRVPTLLLYGAKDVLVDATTSAKRMEELATKEGKDFTIHIYPESGHNLTLDEVRFPADHWDRIFGWIAEKS